MTEITTVGQTIRIAATTNPGLAAGAIKRALLDRGSVTVAAIGASAVNRATRAISLAGVYFAEEQMPPFSATINGRRMNTNPGSGVVVEWTCSVLQEQSV